MSSHSDGATDVVLFLKTSDIRIQIDAKSGQKTFREKLAEVGTLSDPLSKGEIVAIELLTQQSHDIHVPPAAMIQLDERITKQHNNKTFRLVWRERLSAESDSDEESAHAVDDVSFVAPQPVVSAVSTAARRKLARADSDVVPGYLKQLGLKTSTPPASPRRSSLSLHPSKLSSYPTLTPPPVDVGENPPALVPHAPDAPQQRLRSFSGGVSHLSPMLNDSMDTSSGSNQSTRGSTRKLTRQPSVVVSETSDDGDSHPALASRVEHLSLNLESINDVSFPNDTSMDGAYSPMNLSRASTPAPMGDMMEIDTPRSSPGVNVNPFLNVPMPLRQDYMGVFLDDEYDNPDFDPLNQELSFDPAELDKVRKRPRTSSDGIHAPDNMKKLKNEASQAFSRSHQPPGSSSSNPS
eukprot:TRINITY_DN4090_c0_g1_i1.p1 TRINITY_DN4090_c0_g1~~TRINITY_DN4090_c0_g1_i1.p1  ORF type:complete len:408 (-),score=61.78 TRINITY_DN4090_c0_g1_i1:115-1338(-)